MSTETILEVWRGAYRGARDFGSDVHRASDVAQSVALAILTRERDGSASAIRNPIAYGRKLAGRAAWKEAQSRERTGGLMLDVSEGRVA